MQVSIEEKQTLTSHEGCWVKHVEIRGPKEIWQAIVWTFGLSGSETGWLRNHTPKTRKKHRM